MKPKPTPVTRTAGSRGEEYTETHPAFGTMLVTHPNTHPGVHCFGSRAVHGAYISIQITHAERTRHLAHDWIHGRRTILQMRMTHAQFVEMVANPGVNSGVPVTLEWCEGAEVPEYDGEESLLDAQKATVDASLAETKASLDVLIADCQKALDDGKLSKKAHAELSGRLQTLRRAWTSTESFLANSAKKQLEEQSNRARIEMEALFRSRIDELGRPALAAEIQSRLLTGEPANDQA